MHLEAGGPRVFPPIVTTHLIKLACELPDEVARSLSTWTCAELARALMSDRLVDIELLEKMDEATPVSVTGVHLVCDNVSIHHGKLVRAWLAAQGSCAPTVAPCCAPCVPAQTIHLFDHATRDMPMAGCPSIFLLQPPPKHVRTLMSFASVRPPSVRSESEKVRQKAASRESPCKITSLRCGPK
jgi:hypothetical protein